nr:phosphoglycerate mutase [Gloiopeltis furcata]
MQQEPVYPIVLTILDGWGHSEKIEGNAIKLASTPVMDSLWNSYEHTLLNASGRDVGLPEKQMGNSEVGHTTIGSGRIIDQDLVRIGESIKDQTFFRNTKINELCKNLSANKYKLHLIGLCSDGGVHSHIEHLIALINTIKEHNIETCLHVITDGRDTQPQAAKIFVNTITETIRKHRNINICTISGRYYSMDRDCRWSRIEKYYNVLVDNTLGDVDDPIEVIEKCYEQDISDEFIIPTRINHGSISNQDGIIFFNFRPDRMRQLVNSFAKKGFKGFKTKEIEKLSILTFTQYDSSLPVSVVFPTKIKQNFLGEILSNRGFKQFRLAETEKYAHVTYFFNGGNEDPFPGEDRELVSSPQVDTYDSKPQMSAYQITKSAIKALEKNCYKFIVINYSNPDMVGHTGNLQATIKAITVVDECIGKLFKQVKEAKGMLIVTADHGNAEYMVDQDNKPCKSHSTNLVPFIIAQNNTKDTKYKLRDKGCLADVAPTILNILNIPIPNEMNGIPLTKVH